MVRNAVKPLRKSSRSPARDEGISVARMVEDIVGCKWSLHVLGQIRKGTNRPGAIVKSHPNLTTKVMNERLNKMVAYEILHKNSYPEIPPRVEYELTDFGRRLVRILDSIEELQRELASQSSPSPGGRGNWPPVQRGQLSRGR